MPTPEHQAGRPYQASYALSRNGYGATMTITTTNNIIIMILVSQTGPRHNETAQIQNDASAWTPNNCSLTAIGYRVLLELKKGPRGPHGGSGGCRRGAATVLSRCRCGAVAGRY